MSSAHATGSLAQKAYRHVKDDILMARLRPGDLILGTTLSERLGMSRTPAHEALKLLVAEGLLEVIPRVGYRVVQLSIRDALGVFQLRLAIEPLSAELACDRATPGDIEALRELQGRATRTTRTRSNDDIVALRFAIQANETFHLAVANIAGNRRLTELLESLFGDSRRLLLIDPELRGNVALVPSGEHAEVIAAIAAHDGPAAREAMTRHVRDGHLRVMQRLIGERSAMPPGPSRRLSPKRLARVARED